MHTFVAVAYGDMLLTHAQYILYVFHANTQACTKSVIEIQTTHVATGIGKPSK